MFIGFAIFFDLSLYYTDIYYTTKDGWYNLLQATTMSVTDVAEHRKKVIKVPKILFHCKNDNILNNIDTYHYEAIIVDYGDICSHCVINIQNISGNSNIDDGLYFAFDLERKFNGDNPFSGGGYKGTRIHLNCVPIENQVWDCSFMGRIIPFVQVTSAEVSDNQEDGVDQRMINGDTLCLPFIKVYGTNQYDLNQDSVIDIEFHFTNLKEFKDDSVLTNSDLTIYSFSNFIFFTNGMPIPALYGDTIKFNGIITEDWDKFKPGKYLLRYLHKTTTWDETYWEFGETGYLKLLIRSNNQIHSAWIQFRVDLDSSCKCSVTILDSYFNPLPKQTSIVGIKQ